MQTEITFNHKKVIYSEILHRKLRNKLNQVFFENFLGKQNAIYIYAKSKNFGKLSKRKGHITKSRIS